MIHLSIRSLLSLCLLHVHLLLLGVALALVSLLPSPSFPMFFFPFYVALSFQSRRNLLSVFGFVSFFRGFLVL